MTRKKTTQPIVDGLKRLQAADYPIDTGFRCFEIIIPDDPKHLAALNGVVQVLGRNWSWTGTAEERQSRSQLWREACALTDWEELCMDCAGVADCIETDEGVRDALTTFINSVTGDSRSNGGHGREMTDAETDQDLAGSSNPTCDEDILYAQCRAIIDETHLAALDVLQKVEVFSNAIEVIKNTWDSIPILGALDEVAGVDGMLEMVNYWQEAIQEQYEAQWSETTGEIRDLLAYRLFCRCRPDCIINIDRILFVYANELAAYFAVPPLADLINFLEFVGGLEANEDFVVYITHFVAWGLVKLLRYLFGRRYDKILELIIVMKADEPSNDWEALETIFGACVYAVNVRADAETDMDTDFFGNVTDFTVETGLSYALNPTGVWNYGEEGDIGAIGHVTTNEAAQVPAAGLGRLIYCIGKTNNWQMTDTDFEFTADATGKLYLAQNDVPTTHYDNTGVLVCEIAEI